MKHDNNKLVVRTIYCLYICLFVSSCQQKEHMFKNGYEIDRFVKDYVRFHIVNTTESMGNGERNIYIHSIVVENYSDEFFNYMDFVDIAKKYIESKPSNIPVGCVSFAKPDKDYFEAMRENNSLESDRHKIIEVRFLSPDSINTIGRVFSVSIYDQSGTYKEIRLDDIHRIEHKKSYSFENSSIYISYPWLR